MRVHRSQSSWKLSAALPLAFAVLGAAPPVSTPPLVPANAELVLKEVRAAGGRAVLVNVWATWCVPCREEMPDLLRLLREQERSGFRLILVSGDFPEEAESARKFLEDLRFSARTFLKDEPDQAFIDRLSPRWTGALPASFLYDEDGKLVDFWEGKVSYDEVRGKVLPLLDADEGSGRKGRKGMDG